MCLWSTGKLSHTVSGYHHESRNTSSVSTMLFWTKISRQLMPGFILYRHSWPPEDETWLWWSPLTSLYTQDLKICVINYDFLGSIKQISRQNECCSGGADRSHRQKHRQPWSGSLSAQWRVKQISERWPVRSVLDVRASEQVKWWMLPLNDRWRTEMCCRNP